MLVLTRRENERIVLPTLRTSVQVVRISGSTVRLGVEAPPEVPVLREELMESFQPRYDAKADHGSSRPVEPGGLLEPQQVEALSHSPYERLFDWLLGALECIDGQLAQGDIEAARETVRQALAHARRNRSEVRTSTEADCRMKATAAPGDRVALVVQNVKKSQRPIAAVLERAGFKVRIVPNGCRALDYLANNPPPELIIVDFDQPEQGRKSPCSGARAVREIRHNPGLKGIKVIALASRSPAELQVSIGPHGVDQWVQTETQAEVLFRELGR